MTLSRGVSRAAKGRHGYDAGCLHNGGSKVREALAVDVYRRTLSGYLPAERAGSVNFYHAINVLDFQMRLITLLSAAVARTTGVSAVRIPRSLGFGTLQSLLRQIQRDVRSANTPLPRIQTIVDSVISVTDRTIATGSYGQQSLKRLRDLASHGGSVSPDVDLTPTITELSVLVGNFFADSVFVSESDSFQLSMVDADELQNVSLAPLFFIDGKDNLAIYWRYTHGRATFSLHSSKATEHVQKDEGSLGTLMRILAPAQSSDPLKTFQVDVGRDLAAFAEAGTTPVYYDDGSTFTYFWKYASSADAVDRHDTFRLGADHVREWLSPQNEWVGYSRLLLSVSNWQRVAHRLHHKYLTDEQSIIDSEIDALGWSFSNVPHPGATAVKLMDLGGRTIRNLDFTDLINRVDEDLRTVIGQTEIVFVTGEAGIGKTQALFSAAKDRAHVVASYGDTDPSVLPLYLYVRASGNVLADLTDSIGSAVSATRGLTQDAVAALCRNGLMALIIDGFDELLGGTAYSDALGSLRTWLERLDGRGVTVVSARSSYYLNQYRRSVQQAELSGQLAIYHQVAQLQPWSENKMVQHLKDLGLESAGLQRLKAGERRLLRLPFFLRVYGQMLLESQRAKEGVAAAQRGSIVEYLLGNYLAREAMKLQPDGADTPLVSPAEIERLFEFCAEMMSTRAEHFLDSDDLELAAAMVIASDLDTRPGLKTRLPALCGLSVSSGGDARFSFSHEVFYDHFLGGAAVHYVSASTGYDPYLLVLMRRSIWGTAAVERLVSDSGASALLTLLSQVVPDRHAETPSEKRVLSSNLGALLAAVTRSPEATFDRLRLEGLEIDDQIDLTALAVSSCEFIECRVAVLILPPADPWSISLQGSSISELRIRGSSSIAGLTNCSSRLIEHVVTDSDYVEDSESIGEMLALRGAGVTDRINRTSELVPELVLCKRRFLRKLADAGIGTLVLVDRDKLPSEDHRPDWIAEIGYDTWRRFVADLVACDFAKMESFPTKGQTKVRLRLNVGPESILDGTASRGDLANFWSL
jgi:hypothetical protein